MKHIKLRIPENGYEFLHLLTTKLDTRMTSTSYQLFEMLNFDF